MCGARRSILRTILLPLVRSLNFKPYQQTPILILGRVRKRRPAVSSRPGSILGGTERQGIRHYQDAVCERPALEADAREGRDELRRCYYHSSYRVANCAYPWWEARQGCASGRGCATSCGNECGLAGGSAVAIQEGVLQTAPNDRMAAESLINIGIGSVFAAALGGGIGAATARTLSKLRVFHVTLRCMCLMKHRAPYLI